ncbi:SCO family protein [Gemmatimonas sp.]|uniref:SCO family protein n=1 Tax=Gemmatimonas sp. TaxID=1962908 RepID=UPI003340A510
MTTAPHWQRRMASLVLLGVGIAAPLGASRWLTAFTTDTARALSVAASPPVVPNVALLDADSVSQPLTGDGRALIVDFIATRCHTLCATQNGIYQQLQRDIRARGLASRVRLVTISFDPAWDTPRVLRYFALAQHTDRSVWTVLTPRDSTALMPLLQTFGIRVIRDGTEFVHNTALHIVAPTGRLVGIVPITDVEDALSLAAAQTGRTP